MSNHNHTESGLQFLTTLWLNHALATHETGGYRWVNLCAIVQSALAQGTKKSEILKAIDNGIKAADMPKTIYTGATVAQPTEMKK